MTYAELEELFDELVKRTEESRRKDQINYDVADILDILYKIHDNTTNVEDEGKKQIDALNTEMKEQQKEREERQQRQQDRRNEDRGNRVRRDRRPDNRSEERRQIEELHAIAKSIDSLAKLSDFGYKHIDSRLQSWQSLYSSGGAWNSNFLQISSDINKAGMTLEEFTKNFAQSGFGSHLFGAKNFLDLSGAVRQAARDLNGIGIPANEYNSALSTYTDNLRANNDLYGRSTDELTKKFIDLINEAGTLSSTFGLTTDEFLKYRDNLSNNITFQTATVGLNDSQRENLNTAGSALQKIIPENMFNQMVNATTGEDIPNELRGFAQAEGFERFEEQRNILRQIRDVNPNNPHHNEQTNELMHQLVISLRDSIGKGSPFYDVYVKQGLVRNVSENRMGNNTVSQGIKEAIAMAPKLPNDSNFKFYDGYQDGNKSPTFRNDNNPDAISRLGVATQQGKLQNNAKEENITSGILNNSQKTIDSMLEIRKEGQDKYGAVLDASAVITANSAKHIDGTVSEILDINKNILSNISAFRQILEGLGIAGLAGALLKGRSIMNHMGRLGFGKTAETAAATGAATSILSGGTGGYRFSGTLKPDGTFVRNTGSILNDTKSEIPRLSGYSKLLNVLGVASTLFSIGQDSLRHYNESNLEAEELKNNPNDAGHIKSVHRRNKNDIDADMVSTAGTLATMMATSKAVDKFASHIGGPKRIAIDLAAGAAGGLLGSSVINPITHTISNTVSNIEDKMTGGKIDENNPSDVRRKKNQSIFSRILNPFTDALSYGMDGAFYGGTAGAVAGLVGSPVGSTIGGIGLGTLGAVAGGLYGFGHGLMHDDEDSIVGKSLGNGFTSIEDWFSKPKIETPEKKDDTKSDTKDEFTKDESNHNSIISTHYNHSYASGNEQVDQMKELNDGIRSLNEMMDRNMKLQNDLLNKINNSTKDNTTAVKNQSPII